MKQIKGKKVDAYRIAAKAFDLLQSCSGLLNAVLNKHGNEMSEAAFLDFAEAIGMLDQVTFQVYKTTIKPANADIEKTSRNNVIGGKVLKVDEYTIGNKDFLEALARHADEQHKEGKQATSAWKSGISKHLGLSAWKYIKLRLPGWGYTELDVKELLREKDRKYESR